MGTLSQVDGKRTPKRAQRPFPCCFTGIPCWLSSRLKAGAAVGARVSLRQQGVGGRLSRTICLCSYRGTPRTIDMVPVLPIIDGQRTSRVQTSAATRHWLRSPLLRRVWSALLGFGWALVVINSQYLSSNSSGGVFHFKELVAAPAVALTDAQYVVAEAWHLVDRKYVDRVHIQKDWSKLRLKYLRRPYRTMEDAHAAIREMLGTLGDPYTRFLTPAQYSSLVAAARGEVVGIGVELAPPRIVASTDEDENHRITDTGPSTRGFASVAAVLEASPAARAGIRPDDEIMLVDGQDTTGLEPDDVAALIRGEAGSIVQLRVRHAGSADTKEITIKREPLRLDALSMHGPDGEGLGYVRIRQFNENTAEDLQAAVESMIRRNGGPLRLVVDLRGNPGGYFPDGIDAARLFLPQGQVVVYTHDAKGSVTEIRAREDGALVDTVQTPIWLLVDHGTASASEIFAVALHDNNRAKLIGACTFGKGLVQTVQGLRDGSAVAITTSRYETPKHQNINKKGVCPDIKAVCKAPSLGQDSTPIRAALDCLPP